jgi:hypothetical protein
MSIPSKRQQRAAAAAAAAAGVNPLLPHSTATTIPVGLTQRRKGEQHAEAAAVANDGFDEMGVGRAARLLRFAVDTGGSARGSSGGGGSLQSEGFLLPVVGTVSMHQTRIPLPF